MSGGLTPRRKDSYRTLAFECLDSRQLLSASPSDPQVATPDLIVATAGDAPTVGYSPSQILGAYGFNQLSFGNTPANGAGQTIAIVDAYNDPFLKSDLYKFDTKYGIPAPPSLKIVNQNGGSTLPATKMSWADEIVLDVEWAHAIAPGANILLVEANSTDGSDLEAAEDYARSAPGVVVVSDSWGIPEFSTESAEDSHFVTPAGHPGETFVVAAGDDGAGAQYPSASPDVLSVGGTSLTINSSGGYGSESAWSLGGGAASAYEPKPAFQSSILLGTGRLAPDVSAVADPTTGVEIYNSYENGWAISGGTSAATPIWAALIAIVDQGRALNGDAPLENAQDVLYAMPHSDFHDVTSGSNGNAATPGYDLSTGLGTPIANLLIPDLVKHGATSSSPPTQSLPIVIPEPIVTLPPGIAPPAPASAPLVAGMGPNPFMFPPHGDEIAITVGSVPSGAAGGSSGSVHVGSGQVTINLGLAPVTAGANAVSPSSSSAGFAADALIDPATVQSDSSPLLVDKSAVAMVASVRADADSINASPAHSDHPSSDELPAFLPREEEEEDAALAGVPLAPPVR